MKSLKITLIMSLLAIYLNAQEFVENGSFEDSLASWGTTGSPFIIAHDTTFSGENSLYISTVTQDKAYVYQYLPVPTAYLDAHFWVYPVNEDYNHEIVFVDKWADPQQIIVCSVSVRSANFASRSGDKLVVKPPALKINQWNHIYIQSLPSGELNIYANDTLRISHFNENPVPMEAFLMGDKSNSVAYGSVYYDAVSIVPIFNCNFSANITSGISPLSVQFYDASNPNATSWEWDFENDGIIDSQGKNPSYIFQGEGTYSVKLISSSAFQIDSLLKENFITVYQASSAPNILSIRDVPDDQGGWVYISFNKCVYDTDSLLLGKAGSSELYTVEIDDGSGWTAAASTVAYGKSEYSVLVPTTMDSTSDSDGIINFRVIAGMNEGNFVSNPFPGYSVDNIHPSAPKGLEGIINAQQNIQLTWQPLPDPDFQYFQIYRSTDGLSYNLINITTGTSFEDKISLMSNSYYYALKSVDYSGNKSEFSETVLITITNLQTGTIPSDYYLSQNYPNPFNPNTKIKYGLKRKSSVKITIYNLLGKKIKTLVNNVEEAGHKTVNWDGTNQTGQKVGVGIYIYKIKTENFVKSKKMMLIN